MKAFSFDVAIIEMLLAGVNMCIGAYPIWPLFQLSWRPMFDKGE
jgi:hypothetical protein